MSSPRAQSLEIEWRLAKRGALAPGFLVVVGTAGQPSYLRCVRRLGVREG